MLGDKFIRYEHKSRDIYFVKPFLSLDSYGCRQQQRTEREKRGRILIIFFDINADCVVIHRHLTSVPGTRWESHVQLNWLNCVSKLFRLSLCVQCALATSPKFPQMTAFECNVNKICKLNLGCACLCTKRGFSGGIRALSHICTFGERESSRCVALVMMMRGFKSYWPGSIWWRVLFRWFYGDLEAGGIYDNLKYTSEYFFIHRFFLKE